MKSTLRNKIEQIINNIGAVRRQWKDTDAILKEVEKALPEEGIKWMQEGDHKDRKGFTMGFNFYRGKVLKLLREKV